MKMKKWIAIVLTMLLLLTGCGKQDTTPSESASSQPEASTEAEKQNIDVDLTALSSTMVYSEVYNMLVEPERYEGKTVRMAGGYSAFLDQNTGAIYRVCMIADAAACCAQGMEFILTDENYPEMESDITVVGTFQTYMENGTQYCHLVDAVLE